MTYTHITWCEHTDTHADVGHSVWMHACSQSQALGLCVCSTTSPFHFAANPLKQLFHMKLLFSGSWEARPRFLDMK